MPPRTRLTRTNTRQVLIYGQLVATIALTGLLAYQAQDAARSHRLTAETVLEDYAHLACRTFVNAASTVLGYQAANPILREFRDLAWPELPPPPDTSKLDLSGIGSPELSPSTRLTFCRFEMESGSLFHTTGHSREHLSAYLDALRRTDYDDRWPFAFLFLPEQETFLIYRRVDKATGRFEGCVTDIGILDFYFEDVLKKRRLLPMSRNKKRIGNDLLSVAVSVGSETIFQSGKVHEQIRAARSFNYGFKGMRVEIVLSGDLADDLVIGGLPGSRLPTLLALLTLTVGLVGITLWQLRRERQLSLRQADSLAAVSHELRTPLAQIQMFAETLILDRVRTPEERRRALEIIFGETKRMGDLVENIIRFTSALHGLSKPALDPIDVLGLFQEQIAHFTRITGRADRFELKVKSSHSILANQNFVRRMLRNLIDNALKYGPADQPIILGSSQSDRQVLLWIEDRGEGVPAQNREMIWTCFERLPKHRNTAVTGTGIGLWLVRELARVQGAQAWVEEGATGGARFVLAFPRQSPNDERIHSENPTPTTLGTESLK